MQENLETSWSRIVEKISGWVEVLFMSLPNILLALVVFILVYWLSKNLRVWTNRYFRKIIKQPAIRELASNIISVLVIILGIILALSVLNLDGALQSLLAGAGVAGLAIGLALQGTLSNSFSGFFIAIKDELNIGDWIETNGFSGTVVQVDLRNTKIKESDNNIVVIPNKMIVENPFKNYGLTKRIRATITCGVGYESDLTAVKETAIQAIREVFPPNDDEQIEFYYTEFGGSSIDFILRFWVDADKKLTALEVKSAGIMTIKKAFDENGINIPFPIRTIISDK